MYPVLFSVGGVGISTFGAFLAMAFFGGSFVIWKRGREEHFEEESLFDAVLLTIFWGLVVARLVYVVLHWGNFEGNILSMLALTKFPGLSMLGGLAGAFLALSYFSWKKQWSYFEIFDVYVLGLALAQGIGSVGLFFNGSGYGTLWNGPWAVNFIGVEGSRHPTQIYGALLYVLLFVVLGRVFVSYRTFEWYKGAQSEAASGLVFFSYLLSLGLIGIVLAGLRPAEFYWRNFAVGGWVSIILVAVGLIGGYSRSGRVLRDDGEKIRVGAGNLIGKRRARGREKVLIGRRRRSRAGEITAGVDIGRELSDKKINSLK